MVQLVHAGQFDLNSKVSNLGTGISQGMQMANQFQAGKQKRLEDTQEQSQLRAVALTSGIKELAGVPVEQRPALFEKMKGNLQKAGIDASVLTDLDFSDEALGRTASSIAPLLPDMSQGMTAKQREMEYLFKAGGLNEQERQNAIKTDLGIRARAGTSALERQAGDPSLASGVADVKRQQALASEEGKAIGKAKGESETVNLVAETKSTIAKAVKLAEAEAKAKGETLTDYARAQAAMPGLEGVVTQLKELAPLATHTFAGQIFDAGVKQAGFGATEGSTARAKFSAIVNNQVLPLLKQTFGAAFTFQEGEALKATMGDINASPEEKLAQLDAFIAGKRREIETQGRELGVSAPASGAEMITLPNGVQVKRVK